MADTNWPEKLRVYGFHLGELVRCTTPRKLANLIVLKVQRWLKHERMAAMPAYYFIDPINICNLRCPLCPTGLGTLARPRGRIALDDLKRIVDEIAPYAYRVELYNWGEPLLHPEIVEIIEYASQRRISVRLSSNLNQLDADLAQRLVKSGLSQLIVSIDGATQESYAAYRQRGQLDRVLSNLALLLNTRRELKLRTPFIIWRMMVGRHNEHEVDTVRKMAHTMGVDSFSTGALFIDTENPEQAEQWLPRDPTYSAYDYGKEKPRESGTAYQLENTWNCHDLWESMVVNWDGGVAPCCWLHDARFDFGNVSQQTVREVWNGSSYVSARRAMGRRPRRPDDTPTICHRCGGHPHYMAY
jgi:radical SAM protein with 4Fe4S-binding SPASM domain